jgi:hypothetical protein
MQFVLIGALSIVAVGLPLWAITDAARRPAASFRQIESDKTRWVLLLVLLTVFFNIAGIAAAIVYLASVRPRLAAPPPAPWAARFLDPATSMQLATDADREQVTQVLQHNVALGSLTFDEFEVRLERALQARTQGELSACVRDLPLSGT